MNYIPPSSASRGLLGMLRLPKFIHISFHFTDVKTEANSQPQIDKAIKDNAHDWLRYSRNCWIVWTRETPEQWYRRMAAIPTLSNVSMLMAYIDLSKTGRSGQFQKWIWEWMDKDRNVNAMPLPKK